MDSSEIPEITVVSILDTDLYKFTMQQAVLQAFPKAQCIHRFKNRSPNMLFSRACIETFKRAVSRLSVVTLTDAEQAWLKSTCSYFTPEYLSYLSQYRFKPDQVHINFEPSQQDPTRGTLDMEVAGPWVETILWEVPLMSLLSEAYFSTDHRDWSYEGQEELAYQKGRALLESGISFSDFGTRRRRSRHTHDLVINGLKRAADEVEGPGKLVGTSNVYLAYKHGIKPSGTIAHEWFMAVGASSGYHHANAKALDLWQKIYGSENLVALTDTFTTEEFFKDFTADRARLWKGIRQDSGDPLIYAPRAKAVYESLGIDPRDHFIVFSDSLNVELAQKIQKQCDNIGMPAVFGIGTHFTNDYRTKSSGFKETSKALNIVIKLASIDGKPCVKLSDDPSKYSGDPAAIREVMEAFELKF
ncbi:nicotinate phosphoribosyltransferase [Gautieria morchelliformis]|nr:nicotinate phosphoribosyltransferase [Gautieria morchelliformis]